MPTSKKIKPYVPPKPWKDITSYSQTKKERVPSTYEARSGSLCVVVTRHILYPGAWTLRCASVGVDYVYLLKSAELKDAIEEAIDYLNARITRMFVDIKSIRS